MARVYTWVLLFEAVLASGSGKRPVFNIVRGALSGRRHRKGGSPPKVNETCNVPENFGFENSEQVKNQNRLFDPLVSI